MLAAVRRQQPAATLRRDHPSGGRVPISGQTDATRPGDNTPRIIHATGAVSHAGPSDQHPHHRGHEEGNGHDHSHDDGLWARVKHAVVPHPHDARTPGHAPFARTSAAQSGDTRGLLDASMSDVPRAADVPAPDRLPSPVRTLRAPLFVLSVILCAAMAAGAHGLLPTVAAQSVHPHTLQHSGHGHHHVSEVDLQRRTSPQNQQRRIRTRRSGQQHARPYYRPRRRRWRLRAPPHRRLRPSPLPATNVRLRICLIRV